MFTTTINTLEQLKKVLLELPNDSFVKSCASLSGATIGQHTRHIIELYQCLLDGYLAAAVYYDNRKRNVQIEEDVDFAVGKIIHIQDTIERPKRKLLLHYKLNGYEDKIESNYCREIMYNLEHTIHHQALIKVAINQFTDIILPDSFGVAPSTLSYRNECAQ